MTVSGEAYMATVTTTHRVPKMSLRRLLSWTSSSTSTTTDIYATSTSSNSFSTFICNNNRTKTCTIEIKCLCKSRNMCYIRISASATSWERVDLCSKILYSNQEISKKRYNRPAFMCTLICFVAKRR